MFRVQTTLSEVLITALLPTLPLVSEIRVSLAYADMVVVVLNIKALELHPQPQLINQQQKWMFADIR
jgi:hypothetical protein